MLSPGFSDQVRETGNFSPRTDGEQAWSASYPAQGKQAAAFLCGLWASACGALRVPAEQAVRSIQVVRAALPAWTEERIESAPAVPSYVADDGFPAEMSVNWSGTRPELRLLFDSLGDERGPSASGGLGRIQEMFTSLPLWHSLAWRPPSRMVHKTYFGLYALPSAQRCAAVAEAMARLGMADAWAGARATVDEADGEREIEFLAVDLADEADARVKVYYRNHGADLDELNRIASVAAHHDAEQARAAYRTLTAGGGDAGEAALSCLAFRSGMDRAAECATYLRLADLAASDQEAVDRTATLLRDEGVDPARFHALADALVPGPLAESRGVLALVSHRAAGRPGDITTYFRFPVYERSRA